MTEAEIEALWNQKLSIYEFARAIERDTLKRAIRAVAQAKTTSHACDAIRALMNESVAENKNV